MMVIFSHELCKEAPKEVDLKHWILGFHSLQAE